MAATGDANGAAAGPRGPAILAVRCSACNTLFRIAAEQVGKDGRRVRCSRCSHVWFADRRSAEREMRNLRFDTRAEPETEMPRAEGVAREPEPHSVAVERSRARQGGAGLGVVTGAIGLLSVLVLILGVYVLAPRISLAVPALAPALEAYAGHVGSALAWIADTASGVGARVGDIWGDAAARLGAGT